MNTPDPWQQNNTQRLSTALAQLRDRLTHAALQFEPPAPVAPASSAAPASAPAPPPVTTPTSPVSDPPPPSATISRTLFQKMLRAPAAIPAALPQAAPPVPAPALPTTKVAEPPPPGGPDPTTQPAPMPWAMDLLAERLALSLFEQNVLLLCVAQELDTRIANLCARAQDDPQKPFPTFALALALFDDPEWEALTPERPLRYWRLLEIHQPAAQSLTASPLRADERIVNYLKGLNHLDDRLSPFLSTLELVAGSMNLGDSQEKQVAFILDSWQQAASTGPLPAVQLVGPDSLSKQLVAFHVANQLNRRLCRLNAESLPPIPADLELLTRLWQRESRLLPVALYFDADDLGAAELERSSAPARFLTRSEGIYFIGIREFNPRLGQAAYAVAVSKPTAAEQQAAWMDALGAEAGGAPARLAAQFNLNLPSLEILASQARAEAGNEGQPLADVAWEVCRNSERPRLDALSQRLEPKATWDDLVLPKAGADLLRQIAAQAVQRNHVYHDWGFERKMNRGFGISALFAGDSGTGKTMAAEVIANELHLNLHRIDLSQVVNKYIGETEKNLRRLFDAAEDGGVILFFDEADALFGKRSEVKDSHDRYANIEINYLLQRIETYRGLAILATNMKSALDPAFLRRLRFVVNFHFPTVADRRLLWSKAFMQHEAGKGLAAPPIEALDYNRLAALNLNGGQVHNVALNAAFLAAQAGGAITMALIFDAARAEFRKQDRLVNELEFKWSKPPATRAPVASPMKAAPTPA